MFYSSAEKQNVFDNEEFFNSYIELRNNEINLNTLLEQPAMKKLLPSLEGKSVIDLGCGYGHNCLDFVNRGARQVIGVDISTKMLEIAKEEIKNEKIQFINMSMMDICRLNEKFDMIYSSLAFHYIEDFDEFCRIMYSTLNDGGYLLFSQEHPIITSTIDGKGHFNYDESGKRVSYTFSNYNELGKRHKKWFIDDVIKYHRNFSSVINALTKAGFIIDTVCEPLPEEWAKERFPEIVKEYIKPNFLIIKAKK